MQSASERMKNQGEGLTHLVPILIGKLLTRVSPLNASTVKKNLGPQSLACDCWNDFLDFFSFRQLYHVNPSFSTDSVDNFIAGLCV
jgi:hypothetical protein